MLGMRTVSAVLGEAKEFLTLQTTEYGLPPFLRHDPAIENHGFIAPVPQILTRQPWF